MDDRNLEIKIKMNVFQLGELIFRYVLVMLTLR